MSEHEEGYRQIDDPVYASVLALLDKMERDPKYLLTPSDIKMLKEGKENALDWGDTAYNWAWKFSEQVTANRTKLEKLAKDLKVADKKEQNLHTVVVYLEAGFKPFVRFNEFAYRIELGGVLPGETEQRSQWTKDADLALLDYLQAHGFPRLTLQTVSHAMFRIASKHPFHPVREYFNELEWDGVPRLDSFLSVYAKVTLATDAEKKFAQQAGRCWLISGVARIFEPGCQADYVLVLLGPQGIFKSTFFRTLCADPRWFLDDLPAEAWTVEARKKLAGKHIVELAEMPHTKKDMERVKAALSQRFDNYRHLYDDRFIDHLRQCIFGGTGNELEINDPTGARRFWIFEGDAMFDIAKLTADRDQLWAEAVAAYRAGDKWYITDPAVEQTAKIIQDKYIVVHPWEQPLRDFLSREKIDAEFSISELLEGPIGKARPTINTGDRSVVAAILKRLKCKVAHYKTGNKWKIKKAIEGNVYKPPTGAHDDPDAVIARTELHQLRRQRDFD